MADISSATHKAGASPAPEPHTSATDSITRAGELASTVNNANEPQEPAETATPPLAHEVPGTVDSAPATGTDARPPDGQEIEPASTTSKAGEEPNVGSGTEAPDHSSEEGDNDIDQDEIKENLLDLASQGSADDIRKCLQNGADILATNEGGETALHIAARSDNAKNLQVLLEDYVRKGLDINIKDDDGWTLLYGAAPYDSRDLVRMILEVKGVDLRAQIPSGETPLYRACYYGNYVVVELMLAKAKEFGYNIIDITNNDGWTPLHTACAEGELQTVRVLMENHAIADKKDKIGQTPLHVASAADRDETVTFLLSKPEGRTLIDLTDANKQTALHLAAERDNSDTVKALADGRAKLDLTDSDGYTALHLCARQGYAGVVKILIQAAANVNARTKRDETALQLAGRGQEGGHHEAIKLLSGALSPRDRKNAVLSFCGLEELEALDRLLEYLDWERLESEEDNIKIRAHLIWNAAHPFSHDVVRQALLEKATPTLNAQRLQPGMPLIGCKLADVGALQWAAYLGDYLVVWWLLYSVHGGKELEDDRKQALKIASWCKNQLLKQDDDKKDEKKVAFEFGGARRMSKEKPAFDPRTNRNLQLLLPDDANDDGQPLQRSDTSASLETGKIGRQDPAKVKKMEDYGRVMDTLRDNQDPPLLPGWSDTDNLFLKPPMDEILKRRPLTEQFEATIVDFYGKKDSRLNFLRRTRSVWEVVYAEEPKANSTSKKKDNAPLAERLEQEPQNYGPFKIMIDARSKIRESGSSPWGVKQTAYTENDLQFRWIHLPANNVSTQAMLELPQANQV
jgi:ankyrin repeat protein